MTTKIERIGSHLVLDTKLRAWHNARQIEQKPQKLPCPRSQNCLPEARTTYQNPGLLTSHCHEVGSDPRAGVKWRQKARRKEKQ